MISGDGVRISSSKIDSLSQPPPFTSKKDVEKFLGVTVWFQDFIANYASILKPVTDLLKKDASFSWNQETEKAVKDILHAISCAPVLRHFDPTLKTKVWTDASQYAIAGWICQEYPDGWHPVVFVSRKLTSAELNYSNPERELLALVYTLVKQGHYLRCGIPFESNVDCNSLEKIQSMELINRRVARWIMLLQDFNVNVKHVNGKLNTVADYLSRNLAVAPTCAQCKKKMKIFAVTTMASSTENNELYQIAAAADPLILEVKEWQKSPKTGARSLLLKQFKEISGKWFFGNRIYIPCNEDIKLQILHRYHDLASAGHQGIRRTKARIVEQYFWTGMDQDIKNYIHTCITCQRHAERSTLLPGHLHPLPIPTERVQDISIDFATIPERPGGWNQLMVIVCRLTKLVKLVPSKNTDTVEKTARRFISNWYSLGFGLPKSITSDRDSKFTSALWTELSRALQFELHLSTARHQQTNGQAEIAIRTYKRTARKFPGLLDKDEWDSNLRILEFALNNSINASTGFSPFLLAFGFNPRCFPEEYARATACLADDTGDFLEDIATNIAKAQFAIQRSQDDQQRQYNKKRVLGRKYHIGDLVLVSSDGINWPSLANVPETLRPRWFGPLKVKAADHAKENYELDFPQSMGKGRFWPQFHVSKLKLFSDRIEMFPSWRDDFDRPDPILNSKGEELFAVDRIIDHKRSGKRGIWKFLIGYKGYPDSHNEWSTVNSSNVSDWAEEWNLLETYVRAHPEVVLPNQPTYHIIRPQTRLEPTTNIRRSSRRPRDTTSHKDSVKSKEATSATHLVAH